MNSTPRAATALLAAVTPILLTSATGCDDPGTVVIGVTTSTEFVDAARLAMEDALADGPIPGLDTIMIPEGASSAPPAIRAAEALVTDSRTIGVVGHSNSSASLAAAPLYNDREVVQLTPTSTAVAYSRAGPFSFRLVPPDDRQGAFLARYLSEILPEGGELAVFYVNDDYGRGLRRAFEEGLGDRDAFRILLELPHTETDVSDEDLDQARSSLAADPPDAIIWLARGTILARYLPVIREAAPDAVILGGDATSSVLRGTPGEGLLNGVHFVDFVDIDATEELRSFAARYEARFGLQATAPTALTYDAMTLLLEGVRTGARTGPQLRNYLASLGGRRPPFQGVTGPVTFDENGDVERPYVILEVGRMPVP